MKKKELQNKLAEAERKNAELLRIAQILTVDKVRLTAQIEAYKKDHPDRFEAVRQVADAVVKLFGYDVNGVKKVQKVDVKPVIYGPDGLAHEDRN